MLRIERMKIENFLGIRRVEVALGDVTIFGAGNWAGKTSIQQAVRMILTGEPARVKLKKDYGQLVHEGQKAATVELTVRGGSQPAVLAAKISAAGKADGLPNPGDIGEPLKCILDPYRFLTMGADDRRGLVMGLYGWEPDPDDMEAKLVERGCAPELAKQVAPFLASGFAGFDSALREAERMASEARGAWKAITGETYGSQKAETWQAKPPAESGGTAVDGLKEQAGRYAKIAEALERCRQDLAEYEPKVEAARERLRAARQASQSLACPDCGAVLRLEGGELVSHEDSPAGTAEDLFALDRDVKELEKGLGVLRAAVGSRERDLAQADAAARALEALQTAKAPDVEDVTRKAAEAHGSVLAWLKVAELVGPAGLPADYLSEALKPLNDRLRHSAERTGWPQVAIRPDMEILIDNRLLGLCSEAQTWCAGAMIAEAIGQAQGTRLLMLDRVDVLEPALRIALIGWCKDLVADGAQVILFATLKQPAKVPGVTAYWLENGMVKEVEEVAA